MKILLPTILVAFLMHGNASAGDPVEVFVQTGHPGGVSAVAFSHDGRYVLTGSDDHTLKLWEVATRREIRTFRGHTEPITAVAFSPDGRYAVSGSSDKTAKLWDVGLGRELRIFTGSYEKVKVVGFSPDGRSVLAVMKHRLRRWEITTGREAEGLDLTAATEGSFEYGDDIEAVSSDGRFALSHGPFHGLALWDLETRRKVRIFLTPELWEKQRTRGLGVAQDGRLVLTSSSFGDEIAVRLWETASGQEIGKIEGYGKLTAVALSPNGRIALVSTYDNKAEKLERATVLLWDLAGGKEVQTLTKQRYPLVSVVAVSLDGRYAMIGTATSVGKDYAGAVILWDLQAGRELKAFKGYANVAGDFALSPDGKDAVLLKHFADGTGVLRIRDISTGLPGRVVSLGEREKLGLFQFAFSPDGHYAVTGNGGKTVQLRDAKTWEAVRTFVGHDILVCSATFSKDSRFVLTGSREHILTPVRRAATVWDTTTGQEIGHWEFPADRDQRCPEFSPDGRHIAVSWPGEITVWDTKDERVALSDKPSEEEGYTSEGWSFSPDGRYLLLSRVTVLEKYRTTEKKGGKITLWEVATGRKRWTRTVEGGLAPLTFSSDSHQALMESGNDLVLWDVMAGREVKRFVGHSGRVRTAVFHPNRPFILSSGGDGTVRIWNLTTGREIAQFVEMGDDDWIAITPKGYFTASEGGGRYLNVREGNEVYGIENFFEQFYRPDIVAEVLRTGETDEMVLARRGEQERVNLSQGFKLPPKVTIVSPRAGEQLNREEGEVVVQAEDRGGGVEEIRLYHNGKAVGGDTRGIKVTGQGPATGKAFRVQLVEGPNVFRAVALSKDRIESNPDEITILFKGRTQEATLHLLLVGINEYKNSVLNLNYAVPDAKGMVGFFNGDKTRLFRDVKRHELYNKEATKEAILAKLQELRATARQDVVVIYLAGHGESIENTWYFVPWEVTNPERDEMMKQRGLSSVELKAQILEIGAQKVLLLMDACKSGAAMLAFASRGVEDRKALAQLARSTGVHVVAASTKDQLASEVKELGHGVFTYTLLEGLNGKADGSPKDGAVTVRELLSYVDARLPEVSEKYKKQAQYPVVDSRGQDFPIATAR